MARWVSRVQAPCRQAAVGGSMGTIVCAVDDSLEAAEALRVAARMGRDAGLRLLVVHVLDSAEARAELGVTRRRRGWELLDRLLDAEGLNGGVDKRVEAG